MAKATTIGTIRKTSKGNSVLILENGVEIYKDGEKVSIDTKYKTLSLFDSTESARNLASKGFLDDEKLTKKLEYISEKNILRDVVAFPASNN